MNNRLKIICILFSVAYLFFVGKVIYFELINNADIFEGFEDGRTGKIETYFYDVAPSSGRYSYPIHLTNQLTGKEVKVEPLRMKIKIEDSPIELPAWLSFCQHFGSFLAGFIVGIILIFLPIQTFRAVRSIIKNEIFDMTNVSRIRRIGYALLLFYACHSFAQIINNICATRMISLEGYTFKGDIDSTMLLLGLAVLLFAEVLKVSLKIKEENDLTI